MKESVIEDVLKKMYLSDIFFWFDKRKIDLSDQSTGDSHAHLIEVIRRRNIHIHNGGVVDSEYVEKYNLYRLKVGDHATVDWCYFDKADRLCRNAVERLENWSESPHIPKLEKK